MSTAYGRSKNRPAVRHACECTAPMKAYPTMPTPNRGLPPLLSVLIALLVPPTAAMAAGARRLVGSRSLQRRVRT